MARVRPRFPRGKSPHKEPQQPQQEQREGQDGTAAAAGQGNEPAPKRTDVVDLTLDSDDEGKQQAPRGKRRRVSSEVEEVNPSPADDPEAKYQKMAQRCARLEEDNERLLRELEEANAEAQSTAKQNRTLAHQRQEVTQQLDLEKRKLECPVCLDKPKSTMLSCGHVTCEDCFRLVPHCPQCRAKLTDSKARRVYL